MNKLEFYQKLISLKLKKLGGYCLVKAKHLNDEIIALALSECKKELVEKGYTVYTPSELALLLTTEGLNPETLDIQRLHMVHFIKKEFGGILVKEIKPLSTPKQVEQVKKETKTTKQKTQKTNSTQQKIPPQNQTVKTVNKKTTVNKTQKAEKTEKNTKSNSYLYLSLFPNLFLILLVHCGAL